MGSVIGHVTLIYFIITYEINFNFIIKNNEKNFIKAVDLTAGPQLLGGNRGISPGMPEYHFLRAFALFLSFCPFFFALSKNYAKLMN